MYEKALLRFVSNRKASTQYLDSGGEKSLVPSTRDGSLTRWRFQFAQDRGNMILDRAWGNEEAIGYLSIGEALFKKFKDLSLTNREPCGVASRLATLSSRDRYAFISQSLAEFGCHRCGAECLERLQRLKSGIVVAMHQSKTTLVGKAFYVPYRSSMQRFAFHH
jgi:hypothetical protein